MQAREVRHDHHGAEAPAPAGGAVAETVKDPVCGMDVRSGEAAGGSAEHDGVTHWFCGPQCRTRFVAEPDRYTPARR